MSRRLELPDSTYDELLRTAARVGTTPAEWIASQLSYMEIIALTSDSPQDSDEINNANTRLRATRVTGYSTSIDNSDIERDLLRAYETPGRYGETTK